MGKPKTTGRSYGHRLYMNTTSYPEAIGRHPDKIYDNSVKRPHSDDKKPYMDDEYPEMEHFWTPYDLPNIIPPGIPDDPRIPPMDPDQPPDIEEDPDLPPGGEFLGCLFGIPVGPTVIQRGETTWRGIGMDNPFKLDGTMDRWLPDPLVRLYVNYGPVELLTDVRTINTCMVSMGGACLVSALALTDFDEEDYHKIGDYFPVQVVGVTKSGGNCAWDFNVTACPSEVEFEWDYENSAETIVQEGAATVFVTGGASPFEWAVDDPEYHFLQEETTGRENTLYASEDACGTAQITVIDACDDEVEAGVRNVTAGVWVSKGSICGLVTAPPMEAWSQQFSTPYGRLYIEVTLGGQKQYHYQYISFGGDRYYDNEAHCEANYMAACGSGIASPCLIFPSFLDWGQSPHAGNYDYCTGNYMEQCHKEYYWVSRLGTIIDMYNLAYWEWECP